MIQTIDVEIEKIKPYENNPRHNSESVDNVAASIKEFGFKVPMVLDGSFVVICGHTRLLAAKKLGLKTVPCIIADDLDAEKVKAFRLADNKVSEFSKWDAGKLQEELDALSAQFDMSSFGFGTSDSVDPASFDTDVENPPKEGAVNEVVCKSCGMRFVP